MHTTMSVDAELRDAVPAAADGSEACPVAGGAESQACCSEDWMPSSQVLRDTGCEPSAPDEERTGEEEDGRGYMNLRHKYNRNRIEGRTRPKRETARNMCRPLKQWLYAHRDLPYPNKGEKLDLAAKSKMTITQVSNWFANARRRLKKTVSCQPGPLTWERRIKLYNRNVVGNQERLSISSDDSSQDELDEEQEEEQHTSSLYGDEDDFVSYEEAASASPSSSSPTKPSSFTSSGNYSSSSSRGIIFGGDKDALATPGGGDHCPGKFKQGIMQRYLSDAYRVNVVEGSLRDVMRMRNASGSLSSQDYDEELSTGSARSTPVKEQHTEDNLEKSDAYRAGYESCLEDSDENDLHSKELSAVLVLMQFAASKRNLSPKLILRR